MRKLFPLFRPWLVLGNGAAAVGGYLLFPGELQRPRLLAVFFAVCLLAAAGSALNQVLESDLDALMERTRSRPLPSGTLTPLAATLIGMSLATAGQWLLIGWGGPSASLVGAAALMWYLVVYTPLKRRTPFALLVGAFCGMAPPAIGWAAAGGSLSDFRVVLLTGILYLWQVPHFWLLQRRWAVDYRRAGFPLFVPAGNSTFPVAVCRLWLAAVIAGAMMFPAFGIVGHAAPYWCAAFSIPLAVALFKRCEPLLAPCLNLFPLLLTLALSSGR